MPGKMKTIEITEDRVLDIDTKFEFKLAKSLIS